MFEPNDSFIYLLSFILSFSLKRKIANTQAECRMRSGYGKQPIKSKIEVCRVCRSTSKVEYPAKARM